MKKSNFIVMMLLILAISVSIAAAVVRFPGETTLYPRPSNGGVITTTSVNFSAIINDTTAGTGVYNLSIWNTSDRTDALEGDYRYLDSTPLYGNSTFWNKTITMRQGLRHYVVYNITNATGGAVKSSRIAFNVDANYTFIPIGSATVNVNFTMFHGSQAYSCGPMTNANTNMNFNCTIAH